MTNDEYKDYLISLIMEGITFTSDEAEGTQVLDLNNVNLCNTDYLPLHTPDMTPEEINHLLHFDDPDVIRTAGNAAGNGAGTSNPDANSQTNKQDDNGNGPGFSLLDNGKNNADNDANVLGDDSAGLKGNDAGAGDDLGAGQNPPSDPNNYDNVKIPKDADIDKIIQAIINDKNSDGLNHAVIEFAQPSVQDDKGVDYQLYVKPGQQLTKDTIIGTVTLNGVSKPIKSIFGSGTVLATPDGSDFKHLYSGAGANRHIIIEDFEMCGEAPDINMDIIEQIQKKFKSEAYLHQLITDNICQAVLPFILLRRYTEYKYKYIGPIKIRDERPNGREIFGRYLSGLEAIREQYSKDMQYLGTEENVKKTNGNVKKIKALGDLIIGRRKQYANDIINFYKFAKEALPLSEYDPEFGDCKYLALDHDIKEGQRKTETQIGQEDYNNYYMALLSRIDISDSDNTFAKEYYDILQKIIETRMAMEIYSVDSIANEFNILFAKLINKNFPAPFVFLTTYYKSLKDPTYGDVVSWITEQVNQRQSDEYISFSIKQLASMFFFFITYKGVTPISYDYSKKFTTYEVRSYNLNQEFYYHEGHEIPKNLEGIIKGTFADFDNAHYKITGYSDSYDIERNEMPEYAVDIDGVTGWLYAKTKDKIYIRLPKLSTETWNEIRTGYVNRPRNIYELVAQEWVKISSFWEKALNTFETSTIEDCIEELTKLSKSVECYAPWPVLSYLNVGYSTYDHYLFQNYVETDDVPEDEDLGTNYDTKEPEIPSSYPIPDGGSINDLLNDPNAPRMGEPTPKDFNYWVRYFGIATIVSIPFLNCGLDILPFIQMIPLPCIYICVGAIYIQMFDVTMVFGISIRGMYIWPIILLVNLSNQYANVTTPLIGMLKTLQSKMNAKLESMAEKPITALADGYLNMLEKDNQNLRQQNKQLETDIAMIKAKKSKNIQKIKKNFATVQNKAANLKQQVINPLKAERDEEK